MKKNFTILFILVFISRLIIYGEGETEYYNNKKNMDAARSISRLEGVCDVSVLSRKGSVLAGIMLDEKERTDIIYNEAINLLSKTFPKAKKLVLEVETDKAIDIIELSYYIGKDIKNKVLVQRFNYILGTV